METGSVTTSAASYSTSPMGSSAETAGSIAQAPQGSIFSTETAGSIASSAPAAASCSFCAIA